MNTIYLFTASFMFLFALVHTSAIPDVLPKRSTLLLPSKDPFYAVPAGLDHVHPGTILKHRPAPAPLAAFGIVPVKLQESHQILYRTTDSLGNATATVLTVLIPHNADRSKVLSYQVAEDAANINCAPSYALQLESATGPLFGTIITQAEILLILAALEQGWVVIIPDFLGPKAAFIANKLSGQATLDGIRAALGSQSFTGIQDPRITMWGYSGGAIATNWAAELQPTYAPELMIAGAAVGGTVPDFRSALKRVNGDLFAGFVPPAILGLSAQFPEVSALVEQHIKPDAKDKFYRARDRCLVPNAAEFLFADVFGMFDDRNLFFSNPTATAAIENANLGKAVPKIPFYWYKSVLDEASPVADTDAVVSKYCSEGVTIEYVRDIASEHGSYAAIGAPKAISWLKRVMNGETPKPGCSTKTTFSSLLDPATIEILPKYITDALLVILGRPAGPIIFG
ncbi:hypothetical protein NLG97_g2190 [Lecanicillium saksenae]|uniref:Uncharacterized protein n=1 Tax=Lecanicillium saksenae TaxID=468837 RepID=A0ACC1R3G4_9HYPO|nr:hypothetical protein NLG97_g2190 [Lecanicillium saksenae]